jgi:hypothetical protein
MGIITGAAKAAARVKGIARAKGLSAKGMATAAKKKPTPKAAAAGGGKKPPTNGKKKRDQPAIDVRKTPEAAARARKYLKLPAGTPIKGHVVGGGKGANKQPPVLRGVSAKQLSEAHSVTELNKMIKSIRGGRMGKDLTKAEKTSQIKRLEKAIASKNKAKARTEKDVGGIMKAGQRQYDPKTGLVMNKGGLAKRRSVRK